MCGRKTLTKDKAEIIKEYLVKESNAKFDWQPSYNIAPTQTTPILVQNGERKIISMRWGLLPFWAKDQKIGYKMINARSETLTQKQSFAPLLKDHRCIVITDGYYEWKTDNTGKQPYYIFRDNHDFMPMAGLWSQWRSKTGEIINSYTVITTEPAEKIAHIHNRMPAIITSDNMQIWLNYKKFTPGKAVNALNPYREKLNFYPVSKYMNSPKNNSPKCIEKYTAENLSLF